MDQLAEQYTLLQNQLDKFFGYPSFRLGQKEIIQDIMEGKNVLGILPTGSGKSICYQLPARLLEGLTIVVSPLISLMIDQVKQLKAMNFKQAVAINSFMDYRERNDVLRNLSHYKLVYVSPELLQHDQIQQKLGEVKVSLFVIDEAHCISQWGHEFRPDYLKLHEIIHVCNYPAVLALSATATPKVQEDIIQALGNQKMVKHVYDMDRDNIAFCIKEVNDDQEKNAKIIALCKKYRVPSLIYFSSRQAAEKVSQILIQNLGYRIAVYHGGMDQHDRITIQQQFMNNQLDIVCCTSAFGMGINKQNIRLIIHYHLTTQVESYIQEIGRAGRDGEASVSFLLYSKKDIHLPKNIIKKDLPTKHDVMVIFEHLYNLYMADQPLPVKDEAMNRFHINEVQWRFICYQLEHHGIIKDNTIFFKNNVWLRARQQINEYCQHRITMKQAKLNKFLTWVHQKDCLRKYLYHEFQSGYKTPKYQCCTNCGFSWDHWSPVQIVPMEEMTETWQDKLKGKLLVGVKDETE
ncbi:RecQ family ATP-dependent DNA helicase [Virgibacillus salexigens]|uniref:ATP-dependent DNA helicase RecQ n=1 Tax=Virgibacillus massiliensis TaxID=1462526 RepID=A0A024QCU6_9BACI|nr:RecQ family ATP-dependent DNA helicase [Virgibacillus massiliensis]CDQ39776.1 ATP-dependent DNA helicase RecQ [Virgibacillus massiliensis]